MDRLTIAATGTLLASIALAAWAAHGLGLF